MALFRKSYHETLNTVEVKGIAMEECMFAFEGPSCSGKTTVMNELLERHPEWIEVAGHSISTIGINEWRESWAMEHRWKRPIYAANPENTFIVNRPFSEAVYAHDESFRHDCRRVAATYEGISAILYFDAPREVLEERGMTDALPLETVRERYEKLLSVLPHHRIDTDEDLDEVVSSVESIIGGVDGS